MPKFYVYELALPDEMNGLVFYVGKGTGLRITQHERDAVSGVSSPRCDLIRGIWAMGFQITKRKVFESDSVAEVLQEERRRIAEYGLGRLTNLSPGHTYRGDGVARPPQQDHPFHYNLPFLKSQIDGMHRRVHTWDEIAEGMSVPSDKLKRIVYHGTRWVETEMLGKVCTYFTSRGLKTTPREACVEIDEYAAA